MATSQHNNQKAIEAEVSATIKLVMASMEELAALPPDQASEPLVFNERRNRVIRKIWVLAKECIRYGSRTVQPLEPLE
jgi:hypothetical protein